MGHIKPKYDNVSVGGFSVNQKAMGYIGDILSSGIISYGKYSREFENKFSSLHGCRYGVLSNSGTSSLHVALQALKELNGWSNGDEVIIPATTFVATMNIVLHNNMTPVLVDVDPVTYNINPDQIEERITNKTRCIIPVHLFGQPAPMKKIKEIADKYGLKIIEDSCECMFSTHYNQTVGSWGDVACFSMYVAHIIVAGVGGIGITNDLKLAMKMRSLVNHGLAISNLNVDENAQISPMKGRRFLFDSIGHSYRITEFEAALALSQLEEDYVWKTSKIRARNAKHLTHNIKRINSDCGVKIQYPVTLPENTHAYMMYPIMWYENKEDIIQYLNDKGIETRDMLPLIDQPIYCIEKGAYPVSEDIIDRGFYVGCHAGLEPEHTQYLINCLRDYVERYTNML